MFTQFVSGFFQGDVVSHPCISYARQYIPELRTQDLLDIKKPPLSWRSFVSSLELVKLSVDYVGYRTFDFIENITTIRDDHKDFIPKHFGTSFG